MKTYNINGKVFESFEDVVRWAWNEHKLELFGENEMGEIAKQELCKELELIDIEFKQLEKEQK